MEVFRKREPEAEMMGVGRMEASVIFKFVGRREHGAAKENQITSFPFLCQLPSKVHLPVMSSRCNLRIPKGSR